MKIYIFHLLFLKIFVDSTPLDDFVNSFDPYYSFDVIQQYKLDQSRMYVINMTSQKWLNETIVDKPIWWHYLTISVPNKLLRRKDAALLWIGEGSNDDKIPTPTDYDVLLISNFSLATCTISAIIQQIPNQPLVFKDDSLGRKRTEDALIAWGWKKFIENTADPKVLFRFPMTKAVSKAMDTIQNFIKENHHFEIKKFMLAGKSKRGWTTWLNAALDIKRVFSAIPIVMDLLNLNTALHQNFRATNGWTFAFNDYYEVNITKYIDTRELHELQILIDPFYYLDRFKNTNILVISTTGDEFFFPDNTYAYWKNLVAATDGKVLHRRIPNIGHSIMTIGKTILESLKGYFVSTYYDRYFVPKLTWTSPNNSTHGIIRATVTLIPSVLKPFRVQCWYAKSENFTRDFRQAVLQSNGMPALSKVRWTTTQDNIIEQKKNNELIYSISFPRPTIYWLGFFLEFYFPGLQGTINIVTTEVNIIPEYYPYEDCTKTSCIGSLV